MMKKEKRLVSILFFSILLATVSIITLMLFYRQCLENLRNPDGPYPADMKAYIQEIQGLNKLYSFPYPVFFKLAAFLHLFMGPELAVALATMILNSLAIILAKRELDEQVLPVMQSLFPKMEWISEILLSVLTVSLFFVSMLFLPFGIKLPGIKYTYMGVFTANPFHNATYMAARPFAILSFTWFAKLLQDYEENGNAKDYILFSFFLLIATMTKPSFTFIMVGAAGLIMCGRLFRSKFKNLKQIVLLGLTFIPTFIDLLYQFQDVFVSKDGSEKGIGISFGLLWGRFCDNIPLAIVLAIGFPLIVLAFNFDEIKNNIRYRLAWTVYLMGFVTTFFLYEKGFRIVDFNFSWGYMYGIFFLFLCSLEVLIRKTAQKKSLRSLTLQWLVYGCHLACGGVYFYRIFIGMDF